MTEPAFPKKSPAEFVAPTEMLPLEAAAVSIATVPTEDDGTIAKEVPPPVLAKL